MPRWASRLTLHVIDVRVQRLQEISEEDALAEGVALRHPVDSAYAEFIDLWGSLHGPGAWAANQWVAAISFRVQQANIDAVHSREETSP